MEFFLLQVIAFVNFNNDSHLGTGLPIMVAKAYFKGDKQSLDGPSFMTWFLVCKPVARIALYGSIYITISLSIERYIGNEAFHHNLLAALILLICRLLLSNILPFLIFIRFRRGIPFRKFKMAKAPAFALFSSGDYYSCCL